ncbi:hypothetical protein CGMCC3_g17788 [Colletotrichum fructicola]|nr:uncharacterized protein CGMCC3_g17788 [Colletotrichum fructicola]KAE9566037.1 hypothetical protein CGMCC3_g17788 [Colletotrichum fructicola]
MPGPSWLSVGAAPPSRTVRVRCRQQGHPRLTVKRHCAVLQPARTAQHRVACVAPGQAAGMPKVPSTLTGAARRVVPRRLTGRPSPVFSAPTRRPPRSRSSTHINDPPRSACRQHLAPDAVADPSTKSRPEPATRHQRHTPPAVHTNVPVHAPTNTMATSQNEGAESGEWHESLQIRDKRSSSADPESLIPAEVERLMAEYTQGIDTNLPSKSKGKTYYVVWKGRKCGIFTSWPQCMAQTSGFSGARFKGTRTFQEAEGKLRDELIKEVSRSHPRSIAETSDVPRAFASSPALPHRDNPNRDRPSIIPSRPPSDSALETAAVDGPTDDGGDGPEAAGAQGQERQPLHIPGDPPLCPEQQNAIDLAIQGHNLFITGSGGCGKSVVLKVDTPVILLANVDLDSGLCYGRQGVVVGFVPSDTIQEPRPPSPQNYQDDYDGYRAATERHKRIVDYLKSAWSNKDMFPKVRFSSSCTPEIPKRSICFINPKAM